MYCPHLQNAGHSAALWLAAAPNSTVVTFDLFRSSTSLAALEFLQAKFPGRLRPHRGDSSRTVPHASISAGCDLVHIDGRHQYPAVIEDTLHMLPKVNPGALLIFDDICDPNGCSAVDAIVSGPTLAVCDLEG